MHNKDKHLIEKTILLLAAIITITSICYALLQTRKGFLHEKNTYKGYTYYTSIFLDKDVESYHPEKDIDSFLSEYPDYVFILDEFYKDGLALLYESKKTYKIFNPSKEYIPIAHLGTNKITNKPMAGIRINTIEDQFTPHTLMHELGHYIDACLGSPSQSNEFLAILNEEYKNSNINNDYYSDPREFFAEEFADYITYMENGESIEYLSRKTDTPENCKKTFEYIENA
ncbi:hypothetical protein [Butyrivibrio proteoclasticus]|uniref:hypothetical protein n=1 Tax=Butyrivibrio proteoclasticus TaxID=43305 RepID=UPI00047A42AD|nr:hypothetical protein [Butyrivibrio proteoclasticus]